MRLLHLVPKNTKIDFVGLRWIGFAVTGITMLITVFAITFWGFNEGIDFTGGVVVEARKTDGQVDFDALRTQLEAQDFGEITLQQIGAAGNEVLIRVKPSDAMAGREQEVSDQVKTALGASFTVTKVDVVGPKVSSELFTNGVYACLLSVLVIAIYVAFRFEWQFGVAAFIATFHDVLVTAGLFAVTQMDFDLNAVAALLTLAGYSINDTVVVFDRIRENRRKYKKMPLGELINLSTNQTLSRTVMTSICTALSVIPLVIFGGPALWEFSIAILFGIVIGTYSSIYVASALLLFMPPIGSMEKAAPSDAQTARP